MLAYALAILVIVPVFVFLVFSARTVIRKSVGISTAELATEIMALIESDIAGRIDSIHINGRGSVAQDALRASNTTWEALSAEERDAQIQGIDQRWRVGQYEGDQALLQNEFSEELQENFINFYTETFGFRVFEEVLVADAYGALVSATQRTSDYKQNDEAWWQTARENGVHVGDIEYDDSADAFILPISVAVYDRDDQFLGVYKAGVSIEELVQEIALISRDLNISRIQLLDGLDRLVYSTEAYTFLDDQSASPFAQGVRGGLAEREYSVVTRDGVTTVFAGAVSSGFRLFRGTNWALIVQNDISTSGGAFRDSVIAERWAIGLTIILFSFGLVLMYMASQAISHPLSRLTALISRYGEGDLDVRPSEALLRRSDEVGDLARSFERMRSSLQELTATLEQKVVERTREMEASKQEVERRVSELDRLNALMVGRELRMIELKDRLTGARESGGDDEADNTDV